MMGMHWHRNSVALALPQWFQRSKRGLANIAHFCHYNSHFD